jgi:hypothetical protein
MEKRNKQTNRKKKGEKKEQPGAKGNTNSYHIRNIRSCGFRNKTTRKGDTFGIRFATPSVHGAIQLRFLYSVRINLLYRRSTIT